MCFRKLNFVRLGGEAHDAVRFRKQVQGEGDKAIGSGASTCYSGMGATHKLQAVRYIYNAEE